MIYAKNSDALSYRGIHPNLDMALERITEEFLAGVGSERVEIAPPECLTEFNRVEENDFYAYRGEGHYKLVLSPGDFVVVFPGDAHRIKTQVDGPQEVAKAVFKVKIH